MSCSLHASDLPKPTGVTVNGVLIARDVIAREVQHHPAPTPVDAWKAAARALVIRELLLQEARCQGVEADPLVDDDGRREAPEEALIRALVEREVRTPKPDEKICRRYYAQNRHRFPKDVPYEALADRIAAYLSESVERQASAQYIARLISRARIEGLELPGAEALRVF